MLQLKKGDIVIKMVQEGGWLSLPSGDSVSPATAGWTNGEYALEAAPEPAAPSAEDQLAAERETMRLSFAQLMIGLVKEGWMAQPDAELWLAGTLPPQVSATINLLPVENQFPAKARAIRPSEIIRNDPLVQMLAKVQNRQPEEVDAFFRTYAMV